MCVWFSAWEVGQGGDFLLALPISDHTQAHSPDSPWRRSQEQDPALERRGPVLPVTFLKGRLMWRFLGASGAERHGLAAEGGVGWKLTSTPGEKPGRGGAVLHGHSPPQLPGHRPIEEWAGLLSTHSHTHTDPTTLRDPATPPRSQETLSWTVLSRVTCAPRSVTRQVRLVPWSWGLGVRVSSEEWRVSGSMLSTASPTQENRR